LRDLQPPNSPDLNVLDLGYFCSIQSLQHQKTPRNVDELIEALTDSFEGLQRSTLNNIFLTLQLSMEQIILADGGNNYRLQHLSKVQLERKGIHPSSIQISEKLKNKLTSIE
jgi:hypothetical protein